MQEITIILTLLTPRLNVLGEVSLEILQLNAAQYTEELLGTDGQGDMKLICGIRIVGMNHRARKEDKVCNYQLIN